MNNLIGTITHISHSKSKNVVIITCQVEESFEFLEGQFMMLEVVIEGKNVKRAYSIYSTNAILQDTQTISFCIKHKEGGVFSTRATQSAQIGDTINMLGPVGRFIDDKRSKNYVFISAGSGLSPCFSLYQHLLSIKSYHKIANVFGERYSSHIPEEVILLYSLQNLNINNQIFLSQEDKNLDRQNVVYCPGYVQLGLDNALQFLGKNVVQSGDLTVFICGLPSMCDDVSQQLLDKGVPKSRLVIEKY